MAQTSEFKTIQAGPAMLDMAMAPLVAQGYRPILMSTDHDSQGAIIVVVIRPALRLSPHIPTILKPGIEAFDHNT